MGRESVLPLCGYALEAGDAHCWDPGISGCPPKYALSMGPADRQSAQSARGNSHPPWAAYGPRFWACLRRCMCRQMPLCSTTCLLDAAVICWRHLESCHGRRGPSKLPSYWQRLPTQLRATSVITEPTRSQGSQLYSAKSIIIYYIIALPGCTQGCLPSHESPRCMC